MHLHAPKPTCAAVGDGVGAGRGARARAHASAQTAHGCLQPCYACAKRLGMMHCGAKRQACGWGEVAGTPITTHTPAHAQAYWHSSAHVLGQALELEFGADLTIGPALEEGFYYDCHLGDKVRRACMSARLCVPCAGACVLLHARTGGPRGQGVWSMSYCMHACVSSCACELPSAWLAGVGERTQQWVL